MEILERTGHIALIVIVILIVASSCHSQLNNDRQKNIIFLLDSIKTVNAPDKRISLWNVSFVDSLNKIKLIGELDKKEAYNDIVDIVEKKYPKLENNIKLLPEESDEQVVNALVNNSVANLRSNPRHSAEISTQVLLGTPIKILKKTKGWYLVQTPNKYIAWVDVQAIVKINKTELSEYKKSKKVIYNRQYGFSYSKPDKNSQTISDLVIGCILSVTNYNNDFYKVKYPDKRVAFVRKTEVVYAEEIFNKKIVEKELVKTAKKFLGIPYLWGGTSSKAIDCSGFTSLIYLMNGTVLQRDASQQIKYGKKITSKYEYKNLRVGDLLFFGRKASRKRPEKITHVAMYIGNTEFIHASGMVRINSIDSTKNNFDAEYAPRFIRAIRVKNEKDKIGIQQINENEFYREIIR